MQAAITLMVLSTGAIIRARHISRGVALPAAAAPRRAPLREGLQHCEAVQAVLLQASGAISEHGGKISQYRYTR